MQHLITIEHHQTTNYLFDTETETWESAAQEFADALNAGTIVIDWDAVEKPVDVLNVCDRIDGNGWVQTTNKGTGENIVNIKNLPEVSAADVKPKDDFGGDDTPDLEDPGELVP